MIDGQVGIDLDITPHQHPGELLYVPMNFKATEFMQ